MNGTKRWLGFSRNGDFAVTESEPFFGWEILFIPRKAGDEPDAKYGKRLESYLDCLFARVYPAVMPHVDVIAKAARRSAEYGSLYWVWKACERLGKPFYETLCGFEAEKAQEELDFFELENFQSFVEGRADVLEEVFERQKDADNRDEARILYVRYLCDLILDIRLLERILAAREGSARKRVLKITSDRRKFCADWEGNWNVLHNVDRHPEDWYGPMRGRLNMDVSDWDGMISVLRMLAKRVTDGRAAPFEHLKVEYPVSRPEELPMREDIEDDVATILHAYGMPNHPTMWTVSRKRGNRYALHILLPLAPMPDDVEPLVVELDMRASGRPAMRTNWEGCRQAAAFAIAMKYGYPKDGLCWDADGKRIGPTDFDRHNTWVPCGKPRKDD